MNLAKAIESAPGGILMLDGAMGTMAAARGLTKPGEIADYLVLTNPQAITDIHASYVAAGSDILRTCTFNANARNLGDRARVADIYAGAVQCARNAGVQWVAGAIGPLGEMIEPFGDIEEDEALDLFAELADPARPYQKHDKCDDQHDQDRQNEIDSIFVQKGSVHITLRIL